jgi:hypothetical protein
MSADQEEIAGIAVIGKAKPQEKRSGDRRDRVIW